MSHEMGIFDKEIQQIRQLKVAVADAVRQSVIDNQQVLIDYQNDQLFDLGEDSEGKKIQRLDKKYKVYSPSYAKEKGSLGLPTDRVTLLLTGEYYRSRKVVIRSDEFEIATDHPNHEKLVKKYGDKIQGLQQGNLETFTNGIVYNNIKKTIDNGLTQSNPAS